MIEKEALLEQLQQQRKALFTLIDDVPEEVLALPNVVDTWSVLDMLAHLTAWDGEALRRLMFVTGESYQSPHDVHDEAYWREWGQKQVELKRVMGARGIKVDMAGTWVRLLARINELERFHYSRWLELNPQLMDSSNLDYIEPLQAWRDEWERSLSLWQKVQRRFRWKK
ncbi:MAG: DinB family protein [Chloroflexota bacterium]